MNEELVIGVDLGGTSIKGALVNSQGTIISKEETPTLADAGPEAVADRIAGVITKLENHALSLGRSVAGVGIGIPGQPDQKKGEVVFAPNLDWRHVPLIDYLRRKTSLPIILENDANAAALGELWCGAGRGAENMVMITIGTGIGAGLIINGSLFHGPNYTAGELGHTVILPEGPLCKCGRKGCLETLTSAPAMVRMAKEAITGGKQTVLAEKKNIDTRDIVDAARAGDEVALEVINVAANYLGMGIGNAINLFNPDKVVIGGGVSKAGDILFCRLITSAMQRALETPADAVAIVPAELGNDAGVIGAAGLVVNNRKSVVH